MSSARVRKWATSICDTRVALLGLCYLVAFGTPLRPQTPDPQKPANTTVYSPASGRSQRQIAQAKSLLEAGAVEQAVVTLRDILRDDPDNGDAHLLLGSALALVPERSEALKELHRAVELQSSSALAYFSLGTAQARFGDSEAARHSFEKSLQLDPGFAEAHVSVAMILAQQHEWASAREHLMESIRIDGNTVAAAQSHYLLAQVLTEQNEPEKALQELNTAISLRPNYPAALVAQGFIRKWQHNDAEAIKAFKKATELSADSFDSNYELGTA